MNSTNNLSTTTQLTIELVQRPSLTPLDEGCQPLIINRLSHYGFEPTWVNSNGVTNVWLFRKNTLANDDAPLLVLAGHTDVVPAGDESQWTFPPFSAEVSDGFIYGRGTSDMKGGLAALITATERYLDSHANTSMDIAFLITSDEEGPAVDGTVKVVEYLQENRITPTWCILAEPSSTDSVGDIIKNGRRGSVTGWVTIEGKQGHVGYPHLAKNPNHLVPRFIQALLDLTWCDGNDYFDPTTFQIVNINAGTGTTNVIPGKAHFDFNLRFSSELTYKTIQNKAEAALNKISQESGYTYSIEWKLFGDPFITGQGHLVNVAQKAIKETNGNDGKLSTSGGTSDGRFIAKTGCEIIELGTTNDTIHKVNERINIQQLDELSEIFERMLVGLVS